MGKTDNLDKRLREHIKYSTTATHKGCWIVNLKESGYTPEIIVLEDVEKTNWQTEEMFWISYLKSLGCRLTNSTAGGDGVLNLTPASREKIGAPRRGIPRTIEVREKLAKACSGWQHTEETKARISAAGRNRKPHVMTDEQRARISAAKRGTKYSPEACARMSEAAKNRVPRTEEHCRNISEAAKKRWAKRKAANANA